MKKSLLIFGILILFSSVCFGGIVIEGFEGKLRIARPGEKAITIKEGEDIGELPSGTWIRVLSGNAQIIIGGVEISLEKGGWVILEIDEETGAVSVRASEKSKGKIKVTSGGSSFSLEKGEEANVVVDEEKGTVNIEIVKGEVEVTTPEETTTLGEGEEITTEFKEEEESKEEEVVIPEEPEEEIIEEASPYQP